MGRLFSRGLLRLPVLFICAAANIFATPFTPLHWQTTVTSGPFAGQKKFTQSNRDANQNFVDDAIDALPASAMLDIVVLLNQCLETAEIQSKFSPAGNIAYVGKYITTVAVRNVPKASAIALASDSAVAFVERVGIGGGDLDVATRTIKARESAISPGIVEGLGLRGSGVVIAVLDSGVADGVHEAIPASKFVAGYDTFTDTFGNPADWHRHGTAVAGAALGTGGPSGNFRGVAPGAKLADLRIFDSMALGNTIDAQEAVDTVVQRKDAWGVRILNLSGGYWFIDGNGNPFGGNGMDHLSDAMNAAVARGIVSVVTMGNRGPNNPFVQTPAAAKDVITVAASDDRITLNRTDDVVATFSSRGPVNPNNRKPDVTAPGVAIMLPNIAISPTGYSSGNGTSFAAPMVAGVAALMLEANPTLTPAAIKEVLKITAETAPSIPGMDSNLAPDSAIEPKYDIGSGSGLIDAYAAILAVTSNRNADVKFPACLDVPVPLGQPCLLSANNQAPPNWANEADIRLASEPPIAGVPNEIIVKVRNTSGGFVVGTKVRIGVYRFAAGNVQFYDLGVITIPSIAPATTVEVRQPWTPELGHRCIQAAIDFPTDLNNYNNLTQRNIEVKPTSSPATFDFFLENPLPAGAVIELVTLVDRAGWTCTVDKPRITLDPFKQCAVPVQITLNPVPRTTPAASVQPAGRTLLGGVTARALDATKGTATCHVYAYAKKCDVNNDFVIDIRDINEIFANRRGFYTANDARSCVTICNKPLCAQ